MHLFIFHKLFIIIFLKEYRTFESPAQIHLVLICDIQQHQQDTATVAL